MQLAASKTGAIFRLWPVVVAYWLAGAKGRLGPRSTLLRAPPAMPAESKPPTPVNPSAEGGSGPSSGDGKAQLSAAPGVETSVSTAALDRGMLMAMTPECPPVASAVASADALTDAQIMLRVKAGDQAAFEYLVQKFRRPMVSFMYRMSRNTAAAEDLAQEVFLRVYRSREGYEASAKFTTWLYRIATNLAVNHARDTRHERPEVTVSLDEPDED